MLVSNYNIPHQIMNNVPIYGTLTRTKIIKFSFRVLLPLTLARWCLPYKTPAVVGQHVWTPSSAVRFSTEDVS